MLTPTELAELGEASALLEALLLHTGLRLTPFQMNRALGLLTMELDQLRRRWTERAREAMLVEIEREEDGRP